MKPLVTTSPGTQSRLRWLWRSWGTRSSQTEQRVATTRSCPALVEAGLALLLLGGCGEGHESLVGTAGAPEETERSRRTSEEQAEPSLTVETTPTAERWQCDDTTSGYSRTPLSCPLTSAYPLHSAKSAAARTTEDLAQMLEERLEEQWNALLSGSPDGGGEELLGPTSYHKAGRLPDLPTREIVDELARRRVVGPDTEQFQELSQACEAPEAIAQHIGGVAVLLDKEELQMPPQGDKVGLPSAPVKRSPEDDDVCPSETGGDTTALRSHNGGTFSFLDRRHLIGAGHVLPTTMCKNGQRLDGFLLAFGVTNRNITSHETIEVPRDQVIDGSTVTVVACDGGSKNGARADWVLLRLDDCASAAKPVPVRWDAPIAVYDEIHTLGHPTLLTMKYSASGKVGKSGKEVFRTNLITDRGHSGAPIFDAEGFLVGIHNGRSDKGCELTCEDDRGPCCRFTRCSTDDCSQDGYATHIQVVAKAWKESREKSSEKECSST